MWKLIKKLWGYIVSIAIIIDKIDDIILQIKSFFSDDDEDRDKE
jgi:hypothetical protein